MQRPSRPSLTAARVIVAVVAPLTVAHASAESPPSTATHAPTDSMAAAPVKVEAPGIDNFSEIQGNRGFGGSLVGFGGATSPTAMPWLKRQGFVTVINLRVATEANADVEASRAAADAAGLKYVHIPFDPGSADVAAAVKAFLAASSAKANQPVYIHCASATRAAAMWMIGRVVEDHWAVGAAAKEAESIAKKPDQAVAIATRYLEASGHPSASPKP